MNKTYKIVRVDRAADKHPVGTVVYSCKFYDYGCASDDTRFTGIKHTSVTLDPKGGYPFFTVPVEDLLEVEHAV